jgi:L-gulonolactone oxidase
MRTPRRFRNWLGNVQFTPQSYHQPTSEAEVLALVNAARQQRRKLRVLGAGHSWSAVCETDGYLVNLDRMAQVLRLDAARRQVTVQAGIRLHRLCAELDRHGLALTNLGSIKEQSIAGAISTGTHGSGVAFGPLGTQVVAMRLVTGRGEVLEIDELRHPDLLAAARVSLGALGVITEVTLQVTPAFNLREVRTPLPFADALALVPARLGEADHVKLWWLPAVDRVQVYRQYRTQDAVRMHRSLLGEDRWTSQQVFAALLGLGARVPRLIAPLQRFIAALQFVPSTRVGISHQVFCLAVPPRHHESEYAVPLSEAAAAIAALRELITQEQHRVHFILEFRPVRADTAWLSPAYGEDVCFIGAYDANRRGWPRFFAAYERLMRRHKGRPHWGKEFSLDAAALAPLYPRWADFLRLRSELDPEQIFVNPLLQRALLGPMENSAAPARASAVG